MTDRQNQEVLTWLQTHPAVTCHSLSRFLLLSLEETRSLLLSAIQQLGKAQFRLIYCLQKAGEGALELVSAEEMMEVESEDMVLFAVQRRQETGDAVYQAEIGLKGMKLEGSLAEGRLEVNQTDGIQPLLQEVRELLPHRKRKTPGLVPSAPKPSSEICKSQPCPSILKSQTSKSKPVCKSQATLKPVQKPAELQAFSSPAKVKNSQVEFVSSEVKSTSPEEKAPAKEGNRVTFSEETSPNEHSVKRRSTPHPSKVKKQTDDISDILKSSLYTVEEDDDETAVTPAPVLKRKQPDPPPRSAPQSSQVSTAERVPTEGMKRVKIAATDTFVDKKGYIVSRDVVREDVVKVTSVPSKPAPESGIPHKKGKQMGIGSFFQKQ